MQRLDTRLEGPLLLAPRLFTDERGFFCETYRRSHFAELGIGEEMVQENHSRSHHGVLRGMHFQLGAGVAKLVRCSRGAIVDVVIDLRRGSPTYAEWEAFALDEENMRLLYCPVGFAHGFCVVSELADVLYRQSDYYSPELERSIAHDDPDVGIDWPLAGAELVISERDRAAPRLVEIADELPFRYGG